MSSRELPPKSCAVPNERQHAISFSLTIPPGQEKLEPMTTLGWLRSCSVVCLLWMATTIPSIGQTFTKLVDFDGKNGNLPESSFVQGFDGNLYGTTYFGGAHGQGTVYKISATGKLTTVFSFCALAKCADGMHPEAGLVAANDG